MIRLPAWFANMAKQFFSRTGGEFSSVLSNLNKNLDWIGVDCVQASLRNPNSIDLRDLKRGPTTIYATIPATYMEMMSPWLRLLVQLALAVCEEEHEDHKRSIVMMLDEFHILGRLKCVETAAAQIAGFQVALWPALQNLSQIQSHYEKNWETFVANCGLIQVFGLGDTSSREYISKMLGTAVTLNRSSSSPTFEQASKEAATGESWSMGSHPLLTADEIGLYFGRDDRYIRQLILRPGFRPLIAQSAYYDKHEIFAGRFDER